MLNLEHFISIASQSVSQIKLSSCLFSVDEGTASATPPSLSAWEGGKGQCPCAGNLPLLSHYPATLAVAKRPLTPGGTSSNQSSFISITDHRWCAVTCFSWILVNCHKCLKMKFPINNRCFIRYSNVTKVLKFLYLKHVLKVPGWIKTMIGHFTYYLKQKGRHAPMASRPFFHQMKSNKSRNMQALPSQKFIWICYRDCGPDMALWYHFWVSGVTYMFICW